MFELDSCWPKRVSSKHLIHNPGCVERASKRLYGAEVGTWAKRLTRWESLLALSIIAPG